MKLARNAKLTLTKQTVDILLTAEVHYLNTSVINMQLSAVPQISAHC